MQWVSFLCCLVLVFSNKICKKKIYNNYHITLNPGRPCYFPLAAAGNKGEWKDLDEEKRKEKLEHYKKILEKVKMALEDEKLDDTLTVNKFLENLDINYEEYHNALGTSERGRVLVLKRNLKERNVNNYNKEWLTAWVSN